MNRLRAVANKSLLALVVLVAGDAQILAASSSDELLRNFVTPPMSAMPPLLDATVWGASTQDIYDEFRWRNRIGLSEGDYSERLAEKPSGTGERRPPYMSAEWKDVVREQARLAAACGVDLMIFSEPGFSGGIAGPWVQPHQAMKKLVWSETLIDGGRRFRGVITPPPDTTGPFQDTPVTHSPIKKATGKNERYYADAAVIAYRLPARAASAAVKVTSSAGNADATLLTNTDLQREVLSLPADRDMAWVQFEYEVPQTIRSIVLATSARGFPAFFPGMTGKLEAQSAQGAFRPIATLAISGGSVLLNSVPQVTVSFEPVKSRVFRVTLSYPPERDTAATAPPGVQMDWFNETFSAPIPSRFSISKVALLADGRVNEFERKAGFAIAQDYYAIATPREAANVPVLTADVVDLSARMAPDGMLEWTPPPGKWTVLRMGYSLLGTVNHIVPAEASGLEVDQLSRSSVRDYIKTFLDLYSDFLPPSSMGADGLRSVLVESAETAPQNWTDDMLAQFQRLRGYDARPWLPALTGVIIQSAAASDKFLWDFRRTIAQLLAQNFYAEMADNLHDRGLNAYFQALEHGFRPQLGDDMEMRRYSDQPGATMWADRPEQSVPDLRGAASVAHLYGQNVVQADSFATVHGLQSYAPRDLKPIADLELASGVNRFWNYGAQRANTWRDDAGVWELYLARSSYLLQQGRFIADVAYFYGEEAPIVTLAALGRLDDAPKNHSYDFVNAEALLELFDVQNGALVTPSGMRYRVLQLGGTSNRMTVAVLRKLRHLVRKGAVIVGSPPIESPSLFDGDAEFRSLVDSLWGDECGTAAGAKCQGIAEGNADGALKKLGVTPDFEFDSPHADADVAYVHRKLADGDLYFVSNRKDRAEQLDARFRVAGKAPELWRAETGETAPVSYGIREGHTTVPLHLEPLGSVFVVFRRPAREESVTLPEVAERVLETLSGPWQVGFQADRGAPPAITLGALTSWSEHPDAGVKYFSGSAVYKKAVNVRKDWIKTQGEIWIDLGEVRDLAEVRVNGTSLGVVWHPPYKFDATTALRPGKNILEIKVTNMWVNRMIGDAQPNSPRYAGAAEALGLSSVFGHSLGNIYRADAPLRPSGLLGPVSLIIRLNPPPFVAEVQ